MLRTKSPVQALTTADRDDALELCSRDLAANVFVAARILEGVLSSQPGTLLGYREDGRLEAMCWASANLVPVGADEPSIGAFADRVRRWRRHCASILGPSEQVGELWRLLSPSWGPARAVRPQQPLMSTMTRPSDLGVELDPRVRPATGEGVGLRMTARARIIRPRESTMPRYLRGRTRPRLEPTPRRCRRGLIRRRRASDSILILM